MILNHRLPPLAKIVRQREKIFDAHAAFHDLLVLLPQNFAPASGTRGKTGAPIEAALPVSRMFAAAADSLADPLPTAQRQPFMRVRKMMIVHKNSLTRAREFVKTKTLNIWGELHRKNLASGFAWRE